LHACGAASARRPRQRRPRRSSRPRHPQRNPSPSTRYAAIERPAIEAHHRIPRRTHQLGPRDATRRGSRRPGQPHLLFQPADGRIIDGGKRGNDARWINHACEPNCEAYEEDGRVYIHALHDIDAGEELNYNYALIYDERHTPALKRLFACRCGTPSCNGTMLAPKRRKRKAG
jgi:hypothetical protein